MRVRFLLFLLFVPSLLLARGDRDFDVRPAPAWVDNAPIDAATAVPRSDARFGIYALLNDHQLRVDGSSTSDFHRRVRKVVSASGVQNASELNFDFDPSYQRLVLHDVAILRNGKRLPRLDPEDVRVIEKEEEADDRIYDGMLTAVVFLSDVRPDDVIDYSWSLEGANPILGGRFADDFDLTSAVPARRIRHRLLWPATRPLHYRSSLAGLEPRVAEHGGVKELTWERSDVAAVEAEDETPDWYSPYDFIQLSEFGSWAEVAQWSEQLFRVDAKSAAAVKELADKIRREHSTQPERLLAAIRFVQDDVRYLGIEMGRNSHEPHQPSATLEQRWGDCKDKAFLLAALLRELGAEAYPALVNTRLRQELDHQLPSPFLFDHVITQVVSGGRTYWIDGTVADQGGTLETIETPNDERALVVRPQTTALASVITNRKGSTLVEQTYTVDAYDQPAILDVRTTYNGNDADEMRAWLASRSLTDVAKEDLNRFAADQPKIETVTAPKVTDDRTKNTIVMTRRYRVRELFKEGRWTFYPRSIERHLQRPDTMIRSMPLAFTYPLDITQRLTITLPDRLPIDETKEVADSPTFRFDSSVDRNGKTITLTYRLQARRDFVAVADVPDHLSKINDVWDKIGYNFHTPDEDVMTPGTAAADLAHAWKSASLPGWAWGAISLTILLIYSIFAFRRNARARRLRAFDRHAQLASAAAEPQRRKSGFRPGEAPASALAVRDVAELRARLESLACWCGARVEAPAELQNARYGDQPLTIASRRCGVCGSEQSVYFTSPLPEAV